MKLRISEDFPGELSQFPRMLSCLEEMQYEGLLSDLELSTNKQLSITLSGSPNRFDDLYVMFYWDRINHFKLMVSHHLQTFN